MGWHGQLELNYRQADGRCVVHDRHVGPLRILRSLYPEGDAICHNVVVHPPAGIAGGDVLDMRIHLGANSHALITTPGATRFYRSLGEQALQTVHVRVDPGARLEWLPMETLVFRQALAENRMRFELAPGAEMFGWDIVALGRPASGEVFDEGRFTQEISLPGRWLERGTLRGDDTLLRDSAVGLAGHTVMATMWFATGDTLASARRDGLLDAARDVVHSDPLKDKAGVTSAHEGVVILRALADCTEPAMALLTRVWERWRPLAWSLPGTVPRVWRT